MTLKTDLVAGNYTCTKTQAFVDWMKKTGTPDGDAEKQLNTSWTSVIKRQSDGSYLSAWSCKELPEFNGSAVFSLGTTHDVDCALFGGKAKITFVQTADNFFDSKADTEAMGMLTWTEKYTDEGIYVEYKSKGESMVEFWERQQSIEGWYVYDHGENEEEYLIATGQDPAMKDSMTDSRFCYKAKSGGYDLVESFGSVSVTHFFKYDEEFTYDFPEIPQMRGRCVVTKENGTTSKILFRKENGKVEEWTLQVGPNGAVYHGTDRDSGVTMKLYYKRFHNPFGKYKFVAAVGLKEFMMSFGIPEAMAEIASNDDLTCDIQDKGEGLVRFIIHSKIQPQDLTYKIGEEYSMESPILPGVKFTATTVVEGDTVLSVIKSPKGTMKGSFKLGNTFCVADTVIEDTGARYKAIFERI